MKKCSSSRRATSRSRDETASKSSAGEDVGKWDLRLYVAGRNPRSVAAFANLKRLCEEYLAGRYNIEIIDLIQNPQLAAADQILAIPTLVRKLPPPISRTILHQSHLRKDFYRGRHTYTGKG